MSIPSPYFVNTPLYGDLYMEEILVDYDYPLLMVLQDASKERYLCMCFDTRGSQQWLIAPIALEDLIALLRNEITLAKAFTDPRTKKILASMDYRTRADSYQLLDADEVPEADYPNPKDYLDPDPCEFDAYIMRIDPAGTIPSGGAQQGRGAV